MLSSAASYLVFIDGDLQHAETILPEMLNRLKTEELDIVVGSRYVNGGGTGSRDLSRLKKTLCHKAQPGDRPFKRFFHD